MNLRIIPVIEFEPWDLGVEDFGDLLDRGEWDDTWNGVLAPLGLRPIRPGSWFIAITDFAGTAAFEKILQVHLMNNAQPSANAIPPLDEIGPIPGGYAFSADGSVQLEPGCCCDLSDLREWNGIFRKANAAERLPIGHACFGLSNEGGVTTVEEHERQQTIRFSYPSPDFGRAIEQAQVEQKEFAESLKAHLVLYTSSTHAEAIVNRLVFDDW